MGVGILARLLAACDAVHWAKCRTSLGYAGAIRERPTLDPQGRQYHVCSREAVPVMDIG
jgi:hypothetical protein